MGQIFLNFRTLLLNWQKNNVSEKLSAHVFPIFGP